MTNAILFKQAHVAAKAMKQADSSLHYTLCFKEALRMIRVAFAKEQANGEWLGYSVGDSCLESCAWGVARKFVEIVERRAKAEAFALRFKIKTIVHETERAVLAKCQQETGGRIADQQWIPKKCIDENGMVSESFLAKNLPAFYQFI